MDERRRKYTDRREEAFYGDNGYYDNPNYSQSGEIYRPDYRNTDYLHKNIPPLWNHHNFPEPSHYFGRARKYDLNERLEGSISTTSISRSRRNTAIAVIVTLVLLVVVGGAIAVAVYFTSLSNVYRTEVATPVPTIPPAQLIFQGNLSIDKNWDPDLSNQSSSTYIEKADNVSKMITQDLTITFVRLSSTSRKFRWTINFDLVLARWDK